MAISNYTILDGGMGTMLQSAGLPVGQLPELWNLSNNDAVAQIHRLYVEAGSHIVFANTFGANRHKLANSGHTPAEVISAAVVAARKATEGTNVKIALDIGPIGQLLEPLGTLSFEEAYDIFKEMVIAGENAGVDLIVFETMSDLYEVKAAVLAAKENTSLPIWTTMTFEASGRTFVGVTVPTMALTLTGLGVDAIGFNCSLGPSELMPLVEELRHWTNLPIIMKPNAGLPNPATGAYDLSPEDFALGLRKATDLGVCIVGGCCGTNPDFIRALCSALENTSPQQREPADRVGVCSATNYATLDGVRVIGERINPTGKKRFQQALREQDLPYILARGIEQQDAGAEILDVNVGLPGIDEKEMMVRTVKELQSVIELPLQLDSSDPDVLEAALRIYNGKPIVNSVNGDGETLERILPLCKKYGASVVGLCMDRTGIPHTAEQRIAIGERILEAAEKYGISPKDVYLDCLTLTVSAQQDQAKETLRAVRHFASKGLHTVLGVSNISFGLPAREHITVNFLIQAMAAGLDLPIVNPNTSAIMDAIASFRVLSCQDKDSEAYIARFADVTPTVVPSASVSSGLTIDVAISRGLKEETASLTRKALETMSELDVVNTLLIPALDAVGARYEKQEIFLPQLINAANAACEGFEVVKTQIAKNGSSSVSKGKIVIATVFGDIHDIGKNIVRVVLENYGYTVIDLGRDVPIESVVETIIREDVRLVGLSALMTTTVSSMAQTITAIRKSGHPCKIMVGGAVLTPEYALEIGADYFSKDAKQSADIAKLVFEN